MGDVLPLPELVSEAEAYRLFSILEDKELRRARQDREIGFYPRKNRIFYRLDELESFVARKLQQSYVPPCQKNSSASADTGSRASPAPPTSTASGMTPELEKSAVDLL